MSNKVIAIVGATGAVGEEAIKVLEKSTVKPKDVRLFASSRSKGKKKSFNGSEIVIEELTKDSLKGVDIAIFSIGSKASKEYIPHAIKQGCVVVDNSSAYRMDENVPLVIPEINEEAIRNHKGIIANPNCTTIVMLMASYPIYKLSRIKKINVASYQAVSGVGQKAIVELDRQTKAYLEGKKIEPSVFQHQIAMNIFSHDTEILENGFNFEEQKAINETKKIISDNEIKISPTFIRVPIMRSHSVAVSLVTEKYLELDDIRKAIDDFPGVKLVDDRKNNYFPMPKDSSGIYDVLVGRIRRGNTDDNEIMLFACGDQLLKGAALNAVQIVEKLVD